MIKLVAVIAISLGSWCAPLMAQSYPTKPVKILVGFAPGGTVDAVGRAMATALTRSLGQTFFVENKPGIGGLLALQEAASATPDGYVLAVGSSGPLTVAPSIYKDRNFDPQRKLDPVIWFINAPGVIVARTNLAVNSVQDLVAYSRTRPGELTMGSAGTASMPHMMGEYFQAREGLKWRHIPYRGSNPALMDVAADRVDVMVDVMPAPVALIRAGKMKAFAVTSKKRSSLLPDTPTLEELGFASYDMGSWMGMVAPKGTPSEVIVKLNTALNAALASKEVIEALKNVGDPVGGTPLDFQNHIAQETKKWSQIITAQKITLE